MWRFLNVSNPKEDRDKRKREAREEYEYEKRKRTYRKEWERDFKWLSYDDDNGVMVCRICRETNMTGKPGTGRNIFFDGCSTFKLYSIKRHDESDNHQRAMGAKAAREALPGTSKAEKMVQKMNQKVVERLIIIFRNVHAMAKHCRPFTDLVRMASLDEAKGLDVGSTYRNDKSAQVFTSFIAEVSLFINI
eukprot:XP_011672627.1 PREDICTED: uncharacterized protein LOC105442334 isoform X1 [Strongylocentrotus purpuratus]